MKPIDAPMTLVDVELLLRHASEISNHRRFVIAGSLVACGAVVNPPPDMVMSRDLDFYPQLDPGRGFEEIAHQLGEGSPFHAQHGFYADPITPALLALPDDWQTRLAPISLAHGVVAFFIDPNDAAIGKLMRGNGQRPALGACGARRRHPECRHDSRPQPRGAVGHCSGDGTPARTSGPHRFATRCRQGARAVVTCSGCRLMSVCETGQVAHRFASTHSPAWFDPAPKPLLESTHRRRAHAAGQRTGRMPPKAQTPMHAQVPYCDTLENAVWRAVTPQ